ncbi:MAG: hypothetical protein AAGG38_04440 [Planctomycetota bacterium]
MSHPAPNALNEMDTAVLGESVWPLRRTLLIVGGAGLLLAVLATALPLFDGGWKRLGFAYLIAYAFALAITLGSLFFVLITTLFRAGWCVAFRRVPEVLAANMPTMGGLAVPVLVMAYFGGADSFIYPWSQDGIHKAGKAIANHNENLKDFGGQGAEDTAPHAASGGGHLFLQTVADDGHASPDHGGGGTEHGSAESDHGGGHAHTHDHGHGEGHHAWTHTAELNPDHSHATPYFVYKKGAWYTSTFFVIRWVFYIAVWSLIGWFFWSRSVRQDADGDLEHTHRREWWAPLSVAAFAVTVTLASFDLLMSLDPVWYSTMFGVYFFAGCFTAAICTTIIILMLGQRAGYFPAVTTDHFHDLGKLLFAFVFFWGYVGFSQFMLIWYASLPETTYWWEIRGVTSVSGDALMDAPATFGSSWTVVAWTLLFAHLLFPFAILLSKHVKRNRVALFTMACWMLVLCYVDIFWVAMPALSSPDLYFGLPEIGCLVFCVAIMLAEALRRASAHSLTAHRDPRMHESLALDTSAWAPIHTH